MQEEIIDKIKKLLRIKRGGTIAEIETALAMAHKLAAKYGIDLKQINENDESRREPITHSETKGLSRLQYENKLSALIIERYFNVRAFIRQSFDKKVVFVGTKSNILIAEYIYNFLVRRFRYEWNNNRGRLRKRESFMWGMYLGLSSKLYQSQKELEEKDGIILISDKVAIRDYITNNFGSTTKMNMKPDHEAAAARYHGYIAGRNTEIKKGLNTAVEHKALPEEI